MAQTKLGNETPSALLPSPNHSFWKRPVWDHAHLSVWQVTVGALGAIALAAVISYVNKRIHQE